MKANGRTTVLLLFLLTNCYGAPNERGILYIGNGEKDGGESEGGVVYDVDSGSRADSGVDGSSSDTDVDGDTDSDVDGDGGGVSDGSSTPDSGDLPDGGDNDSSMDLDADSDTDSDSDGDADSDGDSDSDADADGDCDGWFDAEENLCWENPVQHNVWWSDAAVYCSNLGSGWRLPTIDELLTIVRGCQTVSDCGVSDSCTAVSCRNANCDGCTCQTTEQGCYLPTAFGDWPVGLYACPTYWSSIAVPSSSPEEVWSLNTGCAAVISSIKESSNWVRCVKEGEL